MAQVGELQVKIGIDLTDLNKGIKEATNLLNGFKNSIKSNIKLNLDTTQAITNVNNLQNTVNNISKNTINVKVSTTQAQQQLNKLKLTASELNTLFRNLQILGGMVFYGGYKVIKGSVDEFLSQDREKTFMNTLANYSKEKLAEVDNYIRQLSKQTGKKYEELMLAGNTALSTNVTPEYMPNYVERASKTAVVTRTDTDELIKLSQAIIEAYQIPLEKVGIVMDMLKKTQDKAAVTSLTPMENALRKEANSASSAGLNLSQYLGTQSALSYYLRPDLVSRDMESFFRTVFKPTKSQLEYAQKLNKDKGLNIDFTLAQRNWEAFWNEIKNADLNKTELAKLFSTSASGTFAEVMSKNLDTYKKFQQEIANSSGAVDKAMNTISQSPAQKMEMLKRQIDDAKAKIGEALIPVLEKLAGILSRFAEWISNLTEGQRQLLADVLVGITIFGGLALVLGTVGWVFNMVKEIMFILGPVIKGLVTGFGGLITKIGATIASGGGLIGVLKVIMATMLGKIAVIGAVIYAVWFLYKNWDGCWSAMKGTTQMITGSILAFLGLIVKGVGMAMKALSKIMPDTAIINMVGKLTGNEEMANFKGIFNWAGDGLESAAAWFGEKAGSVLNMAENNHKKVMDYDFQFNPFKGLKKAQNPDDFIPETKPWNPIEDPKGVQIGNPFNGNDELYDNLYGNKAGNGLRKQLKEGKTEAEKMADSIGKLTIQIKDMAKTFEEKIGVFDKFTYKVINSTSLLNRAKKRADMFTKWQEVQNRLMNRVELSENVKADISKMGVDKIAELMALDRMNTDQLMSWSNYTKQVSAISQAQAGNAVYQTSVQVDVQEASAKKIAEEIYRELKRKGIKA